MINDTNASKNGKRTPKRKGNSHKRSIDRDGASKSEKTENCSNESVQLATGLVAYREGQNDDHSENDVNRNFLNVFPSVVRITGGKWPALIVSRAKYWCETCKADGLTRSRPQPQQGIPAWMNKGYRHVAREIGIDTKKRPTQVERAISVLCEKQLITWEKVAAQDYDDFRLGMVSEWSHALRLSPELLEAKDKHWMCVPTSFLRKLKLSPNAAILLAYFQRRCCLDHRRLRVYVGDTKYLAASRIKLIEETGLRDQQIRKAVKELATREYLIVKKQQFRGHPTNHYQLTEYAVDQIIDQE